MTILEYLVLIAGVIVGINLINDLFFHRQKDIFLVLGAFVLSAGFLILAKLTGNAALKSALQTVGGMEFEQYLMDCVLCFMLFAGAREVNLPRFKQNLKPILLLSLLATAVSAVSFGLIFLAIGKMLGLDLDPWICILLGCIVSPTDPIAATGILSKMGLSDDAMNIIECESLFNDGAGVTLYVFVKSIVVHSGNSNFALLMFREIFGAVAVAFVLSFLGTKLLKWSKEPLVQVLCSIATVGLVYIICDHFEFSGAIASVVCGMYFAARTEAFHRGGEIPSENYLYYTRFWGMADDMFNSLLFAMIGLCLLDTRVSKELLCLIPMAVIGAVGARAIGVAAGSTISGIRSLPAHYNLKEYVLLMTWTALRGGLSLALAMSTSAFLDKDTYCLLLNSVYIIIFFTVVVQGLTLRPVYSWLESRKKQRLKEET